MVKASRILHVIVLVALFFSISVPDSRADQIHFPPAPTDAAGAAASFDERALIVTRYNACGREIEYSTRRRAQLDGNYDDQGEGLTDILIAKIAWLTDPRFAEQPCEYPLDVSRPKNPDGSFVHPTAGDFLSATLGSWVDTQCSFSTSSIYLSEEQLSVIFRVKPACMRQQVNEAIRAMVKNKRMGTDDLPCFPNFEVKAKGDWDVNVRDLVRILYMGTLPRQEVLEESTIDYMYKNLLTARGSLSDSSYSVFSDCGEPAGDELGSPEDFADREYWYNEMLSGIGDIFKWLVEHFIYVTGAALASTAGIAAAPFIIAEGEHLADLALPAFDIRIPETENHRLMIEVSKYLTNEKILAELRQMHHDNVEELEEKQDGVRTWLLQTLQTIANHDFDEYNSRPYTRYSLNAILNLYDFAAADDVDLRTASQIVLDLSGAKFAAGSNRGRRIVPFRRLADSDDKPLYEMVNGADHEVARAVVLAGQTQLLDEGIVEGGVSNMIYAAVSTYRWPLPVLEVAIERNQPFVQEIRHDGVEGYYASPSFTMSLGGIRRPAALNVLGIERSVDRGVAMPTVIIPTTAGLSMDDLFAMRGKGSQDKRADNLCGWQGFICGTDPTTSFAYNKGRCTYEDGQPAGPDYIFVNSVACQIPNEIANNGPHFYLGFVRRWCDGTFCEQGRRYGLMEIVEAPMAQPTADVAFQEFKTGRRIAFRAAVPDGNGSGTYVNTNGQSIHFVINDSGSYIVDVDGIPRPAFATRGDVINSDGNGHIIISNPESTRKVVIDYSQWNNPIRREVP